MKTGRYNIAQLLTSPEVEQIVIPELQRDYVWGERNVAGLLSSILDNYKSKVEQTLDIKSSLGFKIESDIVDYLNEEYMRLRYNTRVGFIYAYHDRSLSGQYYLIDGQQRITTIYLILLALYRRSKNADLFRKLYFVDSNPKIDYKVRDVAHSFLVDFIEYELTKIEENDTFKKSSRYYIEYDKDVTAQSIYANYYNVIVSKLSSYNDVEDLINYVENYIEFNYFDTNMSEQGEKLYLYMNSRGESLSTQERIKSVIIGRSDNKLEAGKDWEDWQNFFWKNKQPGIDKNADRGFFEFLKWAAIIHMCINSNTIIKKTTNIDKAKSRVEEIEDYIRIEKNSSIRALQTDWICTYISVNENFSFEWLKRVESAVEQLHNFLGKPAFLDNDFDWFSLTNDTNTIEYVTVLGLLYYIIAFKDIKVHETNTLRVALYLKNLKSEYTLRRNPDRAVIRSINLIQWMADNKIEDVRLLGKYAVQKNDSLNDKYVLRVDDLRWGYYQNDWQDCQCVNPIPDSLGYWETFFRQIINNTDLNRFLRGNHDFIIKVLQRSSISPEDLLNRFIRNVFNCRNKDQLRKDLLEYGDISIYDNGGSDNIGPIWMERWCLLGSDNDDTFWNEYMNGEDSDKHAECVASYLVGNNNNKKEVQILKELGNNLEYMHQKYYLWDDKQQLRIILLQEKQASKFKARELCVQYLQKQIPGSWMWEHNFCVITFAATEQGLIRSNENSNEGYYIDLWYDWYAEGGRWYCRIGHKEKDLSDNVVKSIQDITNEKCNWIIDSSNRTSIKTEEPIYAENPKEDYFNGANSVEDFFKYIWQKLESLNAKGVLNYEI